MEIRTEIRDGDPWRSVTATITTEFVESNRHPPAISNHPATRPKLPPYPGPSEKSHLQN
jgi:hypothetical protein